MASLVAHLVLIALLFFTIDHDFASLVDRGATISPVHGGGGGGGGGVQYVALPATPPAPPRQDTPPVKPTVTVPVETVPVKTPETIPPPAETPPVQPTVTAVAPGATPGTGGPGTGGGTGGGTGPGNGPGNGAGNGPGNGNGATGLGTRPVNRQMMPPFAEPPKSLRGTDIFFTFWLDATGKPQKIELKTEIQDKKFRDKVLEALRDWRFSPARDSNGVAVPDTVTASLKF